MGISLHDVNHVAKEILQSCSISLQNNNIEIKLSRLLDYYHYITLDYDYIFNITLHYDNFVTLFRLVYDYVTFDYNIIVLQNIKMAKL